MKISKKDKAAIDALELQQTALYGRSYGSTDMFIAQMLEAFHAGRYPKTKSLWGFELNENDYYEVKLPWELTQFIIEAIILNEPEFIHDLAKAVTRIHGDAKRHRRRVQGHGPTFKVLPHDPALLHAVMTTAGSTVSVSKAEIKKSILQSTGKVIGDKKAQRILKMIGATPDKGGRPRKIMLAAKKPRQAK